jgi:alkanesulfonate monooxygenase SsuD/methylene tetrahydromethanopterin reductase-like flavin-dependent oxidoreductase (luciferase family)
VADSILVFGRGASPLELSFFGVSAAEAQDRYSEAAEIVLKAMETDTLTYSGRHFSLWVPKIRFGVDAASGRRKLES